MKIISYSLFIIIIAAISFSCKKSKDTTLPIITLNGNYTITDTLNKPYVELGATASDNKDGNITSKIAISGSVDCDSMGSYSIIYTVYDAAGNKNTAERIVNVINTAEFISGTYTVADKWTGSKDTTKNYTASISTSITHNNIILIRNFGGFGNSVIVNATVSGNNLNIPQQTPSGVIPALTNGLNGSGTINTSTGTININYNADWGGSPDYAVTANATYVMSSKKVIIK